MILQTCLFVVLISLSSAAKLTISDHSLDHDTLWNQYKKNYGKSYSDEEDSKRKEIFIENAKEIAHHNLRADLGLHSFRKGINQFTDLTTEEFKDLFFGLDTSDLHIVRNNAAKLTLSDIDHDTLWNQYKTNYGKSYSDEEDSKRKEIFIENAKEIAHHNLRADLGLHSFRKGINQFTDLTAEEFKDLFFGLDTSGLHIVRNNSTKFVRTGKKVPDAVDWRKKGLVTPVQSQGICGSCWAFSAVGALEGQFKKKLGKLVSLSPQQLVDCAGGKYGNKGCRGGWMHKAYNYIKDVGGIEAEEDYSYDGVSGKCRFDEGKVVGTVTGFTMLEDQDEEALKEAVATIGPISIALNVDKKFASYSSGILEDTSCKQDENSLNHAVLIVGYGTENGQDYWIVKNSWSKKWGEDGYIKMKRGENQCGLAIYNVYPTVAKKRE